MLYLFVFHVNVSLKYIFRTELKSLVNEAMKWVQSETFLLGKDFNRIYFNLNFNSSC